ncbi:hypothetical protein [Flavobacterium franklandianum]|nr:hypothetical protein [Flavobacterium franklandianum]
MSKKLSKSEIKFFRSVKEKVCQDSRENTPILFFRDSQPIFIPKRKKK